MEEIREVARLYHKVASQDVKDLAYAFFQSMDDNYDHQISLHEFLGFMSQQEGRYARMDNPHFFRQLARDGSDILEFWDVMTLYYIVESGRPFCRGCRDLILNRMQYFTCVECFHTQGKTFDVCFDCFRRQNFVHERHHTNFLDNHVLLEATRKKALAEATGVTNMQMLTNSESLPIVPARGDTNEMLTNSESSANVPASTNRIEEGSMEEIREVARSYHKVASQEVKNQAFAFFQLMDDNGDFRISLHEFLGFMSQKEGRYARMDNPHFFRQLARDGSDILEFWDVMTLYYIVESGRPFCRGCGELILKGMQYFTCVECFHRQGNTFDVCFDCFRTQKFVHERRHTKFLDNHVLLKATRNKALAEATGDTNMQMLTSSESLPIVQTTGDTNMQMLTNSESLPIVRTTGDTNMQMLTNSESLPIVRTTGDTNEMLANFVSHAIVPTSTDSVRIRRLAAWKALDRAIGLVGIGVGLGGIFSGAGSCSIL